MKKKLTILKTISILSTTGLTFISVSCVFKNETPQEKNNIKENEKDPKKPTLETNEKKREPIKPPLDDETKITPIKPKPINKGKEKDKDKVNPSPKNEKEKPEIVKPSPADDNKKPEPSNPETENKQEEQQKNENENIESNEIFTIENRSDADRKAIDEAKAKAHAKLDIFIGKTKINKFGVSDRPKVEALARKAETLGARLRQTTDDVYDKYASPSDTRYKFNLECYENFLDNFLTYYEEYGPITGMYGKIAYDETFYQYKEKIGLLAYFIDIYNEIGTTNDFLKKGSNERYIEFEFKINYVKNKVQKSDSHFDFVFDQIMEYLDGVNKDLSLVFNEKDRYIVDFEKLDFINPDKIGKVSSWLTKEQIIEYRKKLLYEGVLFDESGKKIQVMFDDIPDDDYINWSDLVYDITGGCNYYNDVIPLLSGVKINESDDFKIYGLEFEYRTNPKEQAKQELALNKFVTEKISEIISVKMTDKQKVAAVHNWITDNMEFTKRDYLNKAIKGDRYWVRETRNPYRFVDDPQKVGLVCEGYARMFQKFMTLLNITSWYIGGDAKPNIFETPEGHAWNVVKIDGKQYYVDCTWDDPVVHPDTSKHSLIHKSIRPHKYDYLLKTWDEIAGEDSVLMQIHSPAIALSHLRNLKGKDFWDIDYLKTSRGKKDFERVKKDYKVFQKHL